MILGSLLIVSGKPDFSPIFSNSGGWFGKTIFIQFYQLKNEKSNQIHNIIHKNENYNTNYINYKYGPYSKKLKNYSINLFSDKKNYLHLKEILVSSSLVDGNNLNTNWWYKLFESKNYNTEKITESFFKEPNQILFDILWRYIDKEIGKKEGDKLFLNTSIESFYQHPEILYGVMNNFIWYFGINFEKSLVNILKDNELKFSLRDWTFDHHLRDSFNSGKCAEKLPKKMFNEYKKSH